MKHLDIYLNQRLKLSQSENILEQLHDVIVKVGNYWRIKGHPNKGTNTKEGYWKAKYETKEKAENALKAYFANKE